MQATLCAIEMVKVLREWNDQRERQGFCRLEIGVGVHSGVCVIGNVGAENRLSYTCLGHAVNLASRVTDLAQAGQVLITEETLNEPYVKEKVQAHPLPPVTVKGVSKPILLFQAEEKNI